MVSTRVSSGRLVTAEQLYWMPDDGRRRELIRGRLIETSPVGGEHGYVVLNVGALLRQFVRQHRLGVVLVGDPGVVLEHDPDTVRAPDVAFYSTARWAQVPDPSRYLELPPDLAVEVVSPTDRPGEVRDKVAMWLAFGVALVWVVDPRRATVRVHRPGGRTTTIGADGSIDGEGVLPGLRLTAREFFD